MNFTKEELQEFESDLIGKGYKIIEDNYKKADYALWKSFGVKYDKHGEKVFDYQIAFLVYNFGKFHKYEGNKPYSVQCDFLLSNDVFSGRVDFSISDDTITAEQFESVCNDFYEKVCVGIILKQKSNINIEYK